MKIKISFFALMLLLSLLVCGSVYSPLPLLAAAMHEAAHIIAARARSVSLNSFDIGIFGARLGISKGIYSYTDEIIVCAAGPAVNLLAALLLSIFKTLSHLGGEAMDIFILSSVSLCAINLLPIRSLDGGRILSAILSHLFSIKVSDICVDILSFLSLVIIWFVSLYLLLKSGASLSLFIFSISLFANIFLEHPQK